VTKVASATAPRLGLGFPARIAVLGAILFADKILLNHFVDFDRAQAAEGLGAFVREAQHWGFRFIVALAAAVVLFAYVRGAELLKTSELAVRSAPMRASWMLVHVLCVGCLVPLSYLLYRDEATSLPFSIIAALWSVFGLGAATSAALAIAPLSLWVRTARALGDIWLYAVIAALIGASAMQMSQRLWGTTAALTFEIVRRVLLPILPTLSADPATRLLSTQNFAVEIADICSGLEGMGLILAFLAVWLLYFRREYIFPRALVLIPAGLLAIFALNIVRIAALMVIGSMGFPDVAEYGFHSQAGWIAFNLVACGIALFSRHSTWLNRRAVATGLQVAIVNPTAAYLMPLLAILAAGVLSRALSGKFETLYPLRLLACLAMLWRYRHRLKALEWRWSWRAPVAGLSVFLLWIIGEHFLVPESGLPDALAAFSPIARGLWITSHVLASVLTVPLAEELAYRGYLMRRLRSTDFESVPYAAVGWFPLFVSALVFGLAHGAMWLPGIAAGAVYGLLLMRRGSLGEPVFAHAITNALIAIAVLGFGQWQLW
jgi:exosortase E/protease (VPEID-CTERM system)